MSYERLIKEIIRAVSSHFNYTEPPSIVTVVKVYSSSADVRYTFQDEEGEIHNVIDRKVPILKPCYGNVDLNLKRGDKVMLVYNGGSAANAYIIGKL